MSAPAQLRSSLIQAPSSRPPVVARRVTLNLDHEGEAEKEDAGSSSGSEKAEVWTQERRRSWTGWEGQTKTESNNDSKMRNSAAASLHDTALVAAALVASESESHGGGDKDEMDDALGEAAIRIGPYFRLYRALARAPGQRTPRDLTEIFNAISSIKDPFIKDVEASVKEAICGRLTFEEHEAGSKIFDYGDPGDKLYLIWSGRVQIEVPRTTEAAELAISNGEQPELRKFCHYESGRVFGELALQNPSSKRKARVTAVFPTQLLVMTVEDYRWCLGHSHDVFVRERVDFLRSSDRAFLEDVPEVDLKAMAAHLSEENYIGEQTILQQGEEVDKVIFVKTGFCKVMRRVHPKFRDMYNRYSEPPPPNAFLSGGASASNAKGSSRAGQALDCGESLTAGTEDVLDLGMGAHKKLRDLEKHCAFSHTRLNLRTGAAAAATAAPGSPAAPSKLPQSAREARDEQATANKLAEGGGEVIVDLLCAGRYYGIMEMMEGLTYQCSVVANPVALVYVISKFDLIRSTSKTILHKLFCDYRSRLSDERLMQRMRQKSRWNSYKRDLLEDIRNRKTKTNGMEVTGFREPAPRRGNVGDLTADDYMRIGGGEKLWDRRAQTPPRPKYTNNNGTEVQHIFTVHATHRPDGRVQDVIVEREARDASMQALDDQIVLTIATARERDKIRRRKRKSDLKEQLEHPLLAAMTTEFNRGKGHHPASAGGSIADEEAEAEVVRELLMMPPQLQQPAEASRKDSGGSGGSGGRKPGTRSMRIITDDVQEAEVQKGGNVVTGISPGGGTVSKLTGLSKMKKTPLKRREKESPKSTSKTAPDVPSKSVPSTDLPDIRAADRSGRKLPSPRSGLAETEGTSIVGGRNAAGKARLEAGQTQNRAISVARRQVTVKSERIQAN